MTGRFKRWRRRAAIVLLVLAVAFGAVSARLFVFPTMGMPDRVDAIVVLGGGGDRLDLGLKLADEGRAPYLVLSRGLPWIPSGLCQKHAGPARVICFSPDPSTTQGEARDVSKLAAAHGWSSLVVVTTRDQVWRAHLRFERCYSGHIYGLGAPIPWYQWPYYVAYQWGGTVKALVTQRGC